MQNEDLEAFTSSLKSKLGDDQMALIADDLGTLITKNTQIYNNLVNKEGEISKLKDEKEKLVIANGNLLQQIPMSNSTNKPKDEEDDVPKSFNFRSLFDEKGKFKK